MVSEPLDRSAGLVASLWRTLQDSCIWLRMYDPNNAEGQES